MSSRPGRRPGTSGTRAAILDAARDAFAERGFDRTTLRAVAAAAGVDPGLVLHYFGSKEQLLVAAIELPFTPREVLPGLLAGDRDSVGERLAAFALTILENPQGRERMVGLVRSAASEPKAAAMVRDLISRELLTPLAEALDADDAPLRATLVGSQMVGLVTARYIIGVEPLASLPADRVAKAIAPTLQRYLVEPLLRD